MQAIVIFHSGFGNTRAIAETLASGIREQGVETECKGIDDIIVEDLVQYDFIAIGGPTHKLRPSKPMLTFLRRMESVDLKGNQTFCFDTRKESRLNKKSMIWLENSAARGIERCARKAGMRILRSRESALVEGREGPLHTNELDRFFQIGVEIGELLKISTPNIGSDITGS